MDWRKWVERREKVRLSDTDWSYLINQEGLRPPLKDEAAEDYQDDLIRAVRRLKLGRRHAAGKRPAPGKVKRQENENVLSDAEASRAAAFTSHVWRLAQSDSKVKALRKRFFADEPLSAEIAILFLKSEAASRLHSGWFRDFGIPIVGHTCTATSKTLYPKRESDYVYSAPVTFEFEWDGNVRKVEWAGSYASLSSSPPVKTLEIDIPDCPTASFSVWPGSVHDELRVVAEALTRNFPWTVGAATWFTLTNAAPDISPLSYREQSRLYHQPNGGYVYKKITIEVEPWVSAREVMKLYRLLQEETLSGENRPLHISSLELFTFVSVYVDGSTDWTWRAVMEKWNAHCPTNAYKDVRRFHRDYDRIARSLTHPRYKNL